MTTRILLVSGSTRAASTNGAALRAIHLLDRAGVDSALYGGLADLPAFNPDDDRQPLPPAVDELRRAIAESDAVLFCTPEYAGTLPGSFKNLLDWTVGGSEIGGKPVAWVNVAAPGRGGGADVTLRTVLGYVTADIVETACLKIAVGRGDLDDEGTIASADALADLGTVVDSLVSHVAAVHGD